jgi:hypothetical protein
MVIFWAYVNEIKHHLIGRVICSNPDGTYCVAAVNYHHFEKENRKGTQFDLSYDELLTGMSKYGSFKPDNSTDIQIGDKIIATYRML